MSMHHFDTDIAKEFGIEESIILQNMLFWTEKNIANQRHFYEGKYWTYNSVRAFSELFPYMTDAKIRRSLKRLEEAGMIITGRFNKVNYDRTLWYSLTEKAFVKMNSSICQNEQMDLSESTNGFVQNDKPIPDSNPDVKQDIKTHIPTKPTNQEYTPDKPAKPQKHKHGEYSHVLLTSDQYLKLCEEWGEPELLRMIKQLDEGIELKKYKYSNHSLAIRKWKEKDSGTPIPKQTEKKILHCAKCGVELNNYICPSCFTNHDTEGNAI